MIVVVFVIYMRQICVIPNGNSEDINVLLYPPSNPSPGRSAKNLRIGCQIRLVIIISLDFEHYRMTAAEVAKTRWS